jgi:uncharacterized protein (DUF58 family)
MKARLFLAIMLGVTLVLAVVGGFTLLWRFFVFAAFILLPSYLWPRLAGRGIEGQTGQTPELGQVGASFEEEFTVSSRSRVPAPLVEVREFTDLPGYENAAAFGLSSRGRQAWRTRVTCRRRGRFTLGALDLKVADPLGFFPVGRRLGAPREIIVYPATLELPFFQALPRLEPGADRRRWLASETGPGASRVREYSSGDSLRHIHWPTTAHTGELMVKEFDPDRSGYSFKNMWIVLEMGPSTEGPGGGEDAAGECGVTIAASVAKRYLESGKHVGMIAAGDPEYVFTPGSGEPQLERMLGALALLKAGGGRAASDVLTDEAERFDEGSALVVIMPSDSPDIISPLRRAADRGALVSVVLLDSASFAGPAAAGMTGAARAARSLAAGGLQVYIVRRGDRLEEVLDSRRVPWRQHHWGAGS